MMSHRLEFIKRRPSPSGHRGQYQDLVSLLKLCFHFIEESDITAINHQANVGKGNGTVGFEQTG